MEPSPFGKFTLLEKVASGGMAEVYRAQVLDLNQKPMVVAIKRILPQYTDDQEFISLLIDEAKVMVQLNHPNIVPMIEFGKIEDCYYIAMEYVTGCTLKDLFQKLLGKDHLCSIDMAVHIAREVGSGLAYAHRKRSENGDRLGLVHRDISPANILLSQEGDVKIADFGISKADIQSHQTEIGVIRGKTGYMSPEQTRSQMSLDQRSDIYSLGIILFELLTGQRLYKAKSIPEALRLVREGVIPPVREIRPEIPIALEKILLRALSKEPEERYQTADAMVDELNEFLIKWAPEGRPVRVTHVNLSGFLRRYFEPTKPERLAPKTKVVGDDETIVDKGAPKGVVLTSSTHSTIATNPQYELSHPESVAPRTEIADPAHEETAFMPTSSYTDAFSKTVYLAKTFSPIVVSGILAGIMVVGLLYWFIYDPIQIVDVLPIKVAVKLDSRPQKARIVLNNAPLDRFTPDVLDLVEGRKVQIELRLGGYEPTHYAFEPIDGMATLPPFVLKPKTKAAPEFASLRIATIPVGANVYLNGSLMEGVTPLKIDALTPGTEYKLRVEKKGYKSKDEILTPEGALTTDLSIILDKVGKPKPEPKRKVRAGKPKPFPKAQAIVKRKEPGLITIGSKPYAEVYLDGKKIGETPFAKQVAPSGKHKIELRSMDRSKRKYRTSITIQPRWHLRCIYNIQTRTKKCKSLGKVK